MVKVSLSNGKEYSLNTSVKEIKNALDNTPGTGKWFCYVGEDSEILIPTNLIEEITKS